MKTPAKRAKERSGTVNLELHMIQNFAPSNLNRDDTGSPKSCDFGGYRRARISSQAIKRAMRGEFKEKRLLDGAELAVRSKRFVEEIAKRLANGGRSFDEAKDVVEAALASLDIRLSSDREKTEYLLYFGEGEVEKIAQFAEQNWDALVTSAAGQKKKGEAKDDQTKRLAAELKQRLDGGKAADLALFGRMLADLPEKNIDAACQVAHAISTHQVSTDFDYYTAVDDLKPQETAGADMIGTVEFNSACFYRYANIDLRQLKDNLGGDAELARKTVRAFLEASRDAIPTGKQNSFAAQNPPSFVFAVVRESGFWSLANAFVKPVRPRGDDDIVQLSVDALVKHWADLTSMYGDPSKVRATCALPSLTVPAPLDACTVGTYTELVERVMGAVKV
jgi:CRISPR system Cascade subunit CasC